MLLGPYFSLQDHGFQWGCKLYKPGQNLAPFALSPLQVRFDPALNSVTRRLCACCFSCVVAPLLIHVARRGGLDSSSQRRQTALGETQRCTSAGSAVCRTLQTRLLSTNDSRPLTWRIRTAEATRSRCLWQCIPVLLAPLQKDLSTLTVSSSSASLSFPLSPPSLSHQTNCLFPLPRFTCTYPLAIMSHSARRGQLLPLTVLRYQPPSPHAQRSDTFRRTAPY